MRDISVRDLLNVAWIACGARSANDARGRRAQPPGWRLRHRGQAAQPSLMETYAPSPTMREFTARVRQSVELAVLAAQVGEIRRGRHRASGRAGDDHSRRQRAAVAIDVVGQPAVQRGAAPAPDLARDVRMSSRRGDEELRAEDVADRVSIRPRGRYRQPQSRPWRPRGSCRRPSRRS